MTDRALPSHRSRLLVAMIDDESLAGDHADASGIGESAASRETDPGR